MLLGNKKSQKKDQNWCLILNPLYNEIDKRKVSRRISESFGLSGEESDDLVSNTPIILLDNLSHDIATQVKEYFRPTGAELLLTNDVYLKRKCYRTVWPEEPTLDFLKPEDIAPEAAEEPAAESETEESSQLLHPDEALTEMRSLREHVEHLKEEKAKSAAARSETDGELVRELNRVKRERDMWREKYDTQRRTAEKLGWELATAQESASQSDQNGALMEEVEKQKALAAAEREKFDELKEEYRQARSVYEEKLLRLQQDLLSWKERATELEEDNAGRRQEREALEQKLQEQEEKIAGSLKRYQMIETEFQQLKQARTDKQDELRRRELKMAELEAAESELQAQLKEEQERYALLDHRYAELQDQFDSRVEEAEQKAQDLAEKVRTLEASQARLIDEIESRSGEAENWEEKSREFESTIRELQDSHEKLEKMLRVNLKQLENREKELELSRRQLRELQTYREQQEVIQKRNQLASELAEKESKLKLLVDEQGRIETEIREREERIGRILAEQEKVEKEILDGKQANRHYLEQLKKEKMPKLRSARIRRPADEEPGHESESDD